MVYLSIPLATDKLSKSQSDIKNNFDQADTTYGTDHYAFSDLTAQNGKHKRVMLHDQTGSVPVVIAGDLALYGKIPVGTDPMQLFYKHDAVATEFALTGKYDPVTATNGRTTLAGNILMQWGFISTPTTSTAVLFATAHTNFTSLYNIQVTAFNVAATSTCEVTLSLVGPTGFTINLSAALVSRSCYWVALGTKT